MRADLAIAIAIAIGLAACGRVGFDAQAVRGDGGGLDDDAGSDDAGSCVRSCIATPPQSGCCAGDSCQIVDFEPVCVSTGTARLGDPCSDAEHCEAGLTCEAIYLTDPRGSCVRLCGVTADCPATAVCAAIGDDMGAIIPAAGSCSSACNDPMGGTGCGADRTCRLFRVVDRQSTIRIVTLCDLVGTFGQGAACNGSKDCAVGLHCNNSVCRQVCRIGQSDCVTGACTGTAPASVIAGVTYGLCA